MLSLEIPGHYVIYSPSLFLSSELTRHEGKLMKRRYPVGKKKVSGNGGQIKRIIIITIIGFVTGKSRALGHNEK